MTWSGSSAEDETTQDKMQFHLIMVAWGDTTELERTIKGNPEQTGERNSRVCNVLKIKKVDFKICIRSTHSIQINVSNNLL